MPKDIVLLIDGTGNHPADRQSNDPDTDVTNVFLLSELLESRSQEVRYLPGIATSGRRILDRLAFNFGIGWNRKRNQGRTFVRRTFQSGDRLFLVGFSRGAAIARDLANELDDEGIPTYAMLLFDCVAAFGLPTAVPGIPQQFNLGKRLRIPPSTRHVHHALALDEMREPFFPTRADPRPGLTVEEVWFAGDHADVGGGRKKRALSEPTLRWAVTRLESHGVSFAAKPPDLQAGPGPDDVHRRADYPRIKERDVDENGNVHRSVERLLDAGYEPLRLKSPLSTHYKLVD